MDVQYEQDVILDSKLYDWIAYSPDGLLVDGGLKGIWVYSPVDWARPTSRALDDP